MALSDAATASRAGDLPVRVSAPAKDAGKAPSAVRVEVLDRQAASKAGVTGVLFTVKRTDGVRSAGTVAVDVDYSGFRNAFGGDYDSRLRLVRLADCPGCAPTPVQARNNLKTGRINADVQIEQAGSTFAIAAAPSGSAGTFTATSLAPSSTWSVGLQSGDFTWSYPMDTPPVPGLSPEVDLNYVSGAVDGRTASTNNQASWVGEGFDYHPGFIERSFKPCAEDIAGGSNTDKVGDQCWATFNGKLVQSVHVSLPGLAGELVQDDAVPGKWRAEEDDGWRVELLTGAPNGDNDGEYWQLTSPDGTRYVFGRNQLPGNTQTNSASTMPVYGNHVNEPCRGATFDSSWCQQAYRWNLEYVVNADSDAMSFFYNKESNNYGRNNSTTATPYTRASYLDHIDYGQREVNGSLTAPIAKVVLTAADRCIPGAPCAPDQPASWPDVPWDQACSAAPCTGKHSPTFWGTKRLAKVTAQVRDGAGFRDVDSWTFTHTFPDTGDGTSATLWLESIVHTGHVGGTAAMPEINFDGVQRHNRVDSDDHREPLAKWRLSRVATETGGLIEVSYTEKECTADALPTPDTNTKKCYPAYWTPEGELQPRLDYFNKFVVTQVKETDLVGGNPPEVTQYDYLDGAAWHRDDAEMTPARFKTYGQYRGFQKVQVRTGDPNSGEQTRTDHLFLRGMDEDLMADGVNRRHVMVSSRLGPVEDSEPFKGFALETVTYDGVTGAEISATLHEVEATGPTATRIRESGPLRSYVTEVKRVRERVALAGGGALETEERHGFDEYGQHKYVDDLGDLSTPADDTCIRFTYARNLTKWLLDLPSDVQEVGVNCDTSAKPEDILAQQRFYYDGATTLGATPTVGNLTHSEELASSDANGQVFVTSERNTFDEHGREIVEEDSLGRKTTTSYTPATGGPVTQVTSTNPLGHTTITHLDPTNGETVAVVDANGRRTDLARDPLGRVTAIWEPGRSKAAGASANSQFEYLIRRDAPSALITRKLLGNGSYLSSHTLYDGFLRERQVQEPAPGGGRTVTDTIHDSHGRVAKTNQAYWNSDAPGTTLLAVRDADVPGQTVFEYDGAGRETAEILFSDGHEKWRTTTTYGGNWVAEDPPAGDTATTTIYDAHDRVVELRQHKADTPTGAYDSTKYTYTRDGHIESVTDPAGNVWRHHYDLRGRQIRVDDPDKGTATFTYDDADRELSATDSRGKRLTFTYDALDRRTAVHEGTTKLAEWTFDTLPNGKGMPAASIRWVGSEAYRSDVLGYDDAGRPTGNAITIPAVEKGLAGRYVTESRYNVADQVESAVLPAVGGLRAETLRYTFDGLGQTTRMTGLTQYVGASSYTQLGEPQQYTFGVSGKQIYQTFSYDRATRRLTRTAVDRQTATQSAVADVNLDYDPAGNVTKIANRPVGGVEDTQCFRTDYLRRMTEAWAATDGCAAGPSLAVLGGPAPYWHSYTYDVVGNRTSETQHAANGDTVRTYTYPAAGAPQPHTLKSVSTTGPGGPRADEFGYDSDGNTTSRKLNGTQQNLSWDAEGHLSTVTEGSKVTSFLYDPDGDRLLRRDPTGTTLYLDDTEVKADQNGTVVSATRYYEHNDDVVAVRTVSAGTESLDWLTSDHQGTAEAAIDAAGLAVDERRSLPFGGPRGAQPGNWPGEKGFVGGTIDLSIGLVHLGAREYDPQTGRFLSVDPIIDHDDPQQMHGYAYSNNAPATFSDPDGLIWDWVKKNLGPGSKAWKAAKIGVSVCSMFLVPACMVGAGVMSAVDAYGYAKKGKWGDAALELVGVGVAGAGLKLWKAGKGVKKAFDTEKGTRAARAAKNGSNGKSANKGNAKKKTNKAKETKNRKEGQIKGKEQKLRNVELGLIGAKAHKNSKDDKRRKGGKKPTAKSDKPPKGMTYTDWRALQAQKKGAAKKPVTKKKTVAKKKTVKKSKPPKPKKKTKPKRKVPKHVLAKSSKY
ncbi:RHS repeat domain-containing protein [Kibdelosporangium persicum]|uniref:Type IV secretion protein Rhs n=1 Tax=Kibdelosporangium persicum TaxID=2698649 RepID=A0ABX2FFE7_9PSEU|nr:Type IV secretion protein Rhs [Kibdelosporangium persicum]